MNIMFYLYHSVPKECIGTVLYPLNELKEIYPEAYVKEFSKYAGRKHITEQQIPGLNCLWNDVLHFSAVHPEKIKEALREAGELSPFKRLYYQVDPRLIDPSRAIVYLYRSQEKMTEENWAPYREMDLEEYASIPQLTKDYYKAMIEQGKHPLLYHRIPHILYKGILDVTNLPIVSS